MKKILSVLITAIYMMTANAFALADRSIQSKANEADYTYLNINDIINCDLYTDVGIELGKEKGSGVFFPSSYSQPNSPELALGIGISEQELIRIKSDENKYISSDGTPFELNLSGAVMMGYNGFKEWEIPCKEYITGFSMLTYATYPVKNNIFSIWVEYEDGTVEVDKGLEIPDFNTINESYIEVKGVRAWDGADVGRRYANVLNFDLQNKVNTPKKVERITIKTDTAYSGAVFMGVTFKRENITLKDDEFSLTDISRYCNGRYITGEMDTDYDVHSGYMGNSTVSINGDYFEKYFGTNNRFYYADTVFGLYNTSKENKGIYTYNEENHRAKISLETDNYKAINMLVNAVAYEGEIYAGTHEQISDVPVRITYVDGSVEEYTFNCGYEDYNTFTKNPPAMICGRITDSVDWDSEKIINKTISRPSATSKGYIYSVEIDVNQNKPISEISVGSKDKRVYIYAITCVRTERDQLLGQINAEIARQLNIYEMPDTLYSDVRLVRKKIDMYMGLGNEQENIDGYNEWQELEKNLNDRLSQKGYIEIFISPNGNDSNDGGENNPVKTLARAQDMARHNMAAFEEYSQIHIVFADGDYHISDTMKITAKDCFDDGKIIYRSKRFGNVNLLGSTELNKEDFDKVIDKNIFSSLPEEAQVYYQDLNKYNIFVPEYSDDCTPGFYADSIEQMIAQYPNDGFTAVKSVLDNNSTDNVTQLELYNEKNWNNITGAFAEGYFEYDYAYQKIPLLNAGDGVITVDGANAINTQQYPGKPRRVRFVNLIEELDSPSEWYLDHKTNTLYWYPENFDKVQSIEITSLSDPMIELQNAYNIEITGLNFKNSLANAIIANNADKITISDCRFENINSDAVYINDCKNTVVKNSRFHNLRRGIVAKNPKYTTENMKNVISNNLFSHIGWGEVQNAAIISNDNGAQIKNNTIYDLPGNAICYQGNDLEIMHNEIYDVCREADDSAAIYTGRRYLDRGSVIKNNYIHDIIPQYGWNSERDFGGESFRWGHGVYLDDAACGQTVSNNIFYNIVSAFCVNSGQFNTCTNNIIVNTKCEGFKVTSYESGSQKRIDRVREEWREAADVIDDYKEKYPELKNGYEYFCAKPANNNVSNNLIIGQDKAFTITEENYSNNGRFENNLVYGKNEFFDFVCEEGNDFRVRKDSAILQILPQLPSEASFDLDNTGYDDTIDRLDYYEQNINSLDKNQIDAAYELLRKTVAQGKTEWNKYNGILKKKAQSGPITVNDCRIIDGILEATLNVADLKNSYEYILIAAVYKNGKLLSVEQIKDGIIGISNEGNGFNKLISSHGEGCTVKLFVWDSFKSMKPYSTVTTEL